MICSLCPRKCNARRTETQNFGGFCKQPLAPKIARAALHFWEEPSISGERGSGTVFFSGCNLGCVYCQNAAISHTGKGKTVTAARLAEIFAELEEKGAENINLVTPTHFVTAIKEALDIYRPNIPIVYNSGGYESVETLSGLEKYIDIYLMDFKYADNAKALKYSKAADYVDVAGLALKEAYAQKPKCVFKNGIMQTGVIVRHLLLPAATNDAIKIFDFVRQNMSGAYFSLMGQYIPVNEACSDAVIGRKITEREYNKVADYILSSGYQNCYFQELSSASTDYVPDFDLIR